MTINTDEKITVIAAIFSSDERVYRAKAIGPARHEYVTGPFDWRAGLIITSREHLANENVTWIRGWHDEDSVEVLAMLAARRLVG